METVKANIEIEKDNTFAGESENYTFLINGVYFQQKLHKTYNEAKQAAYKKLHELKKRGNKHV